MKKVYLDTKYIHFYAPTYRYVYLHFEGKGWVVVYFHHEWMSENISSKSTFQIKVLAVVLDHSNLNICEYFGHMSKEALQDTGTLIN